MYKQLKHAVGKVSRKMVLLFVLFLAILLICSTNYYFAKQYKRLEKLLSTPGNIFKYPAKNNNGWAYTGTGVAIFLITGIIVLLLLEIKTRKKIAEELQMQKEHYRITINSIEEGLITTGKAGEILHMNPAAEKLTGWRIEEARNKPLEMVYDVVNEQSGERIENITSRILKNRKTIEFENNTILETKNLNRFIISNSGSPLFDAKGNIKGTVLVFSNITEKVETQKKLVESEAFSRGVLDSLRSHIAVVNADGKIMKVNKPWTKFSELNGKWNPEKYGEGANYFDVYKSKELGPDSFDLNSLKGIYNVLNGVEEEFYTEYPCHTNEEEKWFCMRVMKFESSETLLVIEHHDITERIKAEEQTIKLVERYDILAKATSDTVWDWDLIHNKMVYNSGITKMFGYQLTEVENVAGWWKNNIHPEDIQTITDTLEEAYKNHIQNIHLEYRFRCTDNSYKYIYDRAFIIYNNQNRPSRMIGAMQDISYEKISRQHIEQQNATLRKITWIHSHKLRSHVANILGLVQLFDHENFADPNNKDLLSMVNECAIKLDEVIHEVTSLASEIKK